MEQQIFQKWLSMVANRKRMDAYDEIKQIAEFWTAMVTGKGIDKVVVTVRNKDTKKKKEIRQRINKTKTRYVTEKVKTTYREVDRCDSIKEMITHKDEDALALIRDREANFFGNKSLDKFNDKYLLQYAAMDPNAFQLTNIKPHDPNTEKPYTYPTIIKSKYLRDYSYKFNDLQYLSYEERRTKKLMVQHLWTKQYAYELTPAKLGAPTADSRLITLPSEPSLDLYIWDPDKQQNRHVSVELPTADVNARDSYYLTRYEHNLGFIPAKQMGWVESFEHKHKVLESFLLPAKERYEELYEKKSAYDTHLAVHGIAKQIMYRMACDYTDPKNQQKCNGGIVGYGDDATTCPKCKDDPGLMPIVRDELDVLTIKIPMNQTGSMEFIDASKLHQYIYIPENIIKMHKEAADEAADDVSLALFNANVFKRAELTAATATEVLQNNKSIDNALYAYGEHRGDFKEFQMRCIATYLDLGDDFQVSIKYPSDYKLETEDELYLRLSLAIKSGASYLAQRNIQRDILNKQNADDPDQVAYAIAIESLKPFHNLSESERLSMISLLRPDTHPKRQALMYFDDVIYYLDSEKTTAGKWFKLDMKKRKEAFNTALQKVIESYNLDPEPDPVAQPFGAVIAE